MSCNKEHFDTNPARIRDWLMAVDFPQESEPSPDNFQPKIHHHSFPQATASLTSNRNAALPENHRREDSISDRKSYATRRVSQWLNYSQQNSNEGGRGSRKEGSRRRAGKAQRSSDLHSSEITARKLPENSRNDRFERWNRRKTRYGYYDAQKVAAQKPRTTPVEAEKKDTGVLQIDTPRNGFSSRPTLRSHKDIMERFDSEAILSSGRLTVQPSLVPGLFLNVRSASSLGFVPDLAYNSMDHFSKVPQRVEADTLQARLSKSVQKVGDCPQFPRCEKEMQGEPQKDVYTAQAHSEFETSTQIPSYTSSENPRSQYPQANRESPLCHAELCSTESQTCLTAHHTMTTPQVEQNKQETNDCVPDQVHIGSCTVNSIVSGRLSEVFRSALLDSQQTADQNLKNAGSSGSHNSPRSGHDEHTNNWSSHQDSINTTTVILANRLPGDDSSSISEATRVETSGSNPSNITLKSSKHDLDIDLAMAEGIKSPWNPTFPEPSVPRRPASTLVEYRDSACQTDPMLFSHDKTKQSCFFNERQNMAQPLVSKLGYREDLESGMTVNDIFLNMSEPPPRDPHQYDELATLVLPSNDGGSTYLEGNINQPPTRSHTRISSGDGHDLSQPSHHSHLPETDFSSLGEQCQPYEYHTGSRITLETPGNWKSFFSGRILGQGCLTSMQGEHAFGQTVSEKPCQLQDYTSEMNRMALGISNLPSSSNFQKEMCHFNHVLQPQLWASRTETSLESFDQTMSMREGHQVYEDIDEAHQEMMRLWRPKRW